MAKLVTEIIKEFEARLKKAEERVETLENAFCEMYCDVYDDYEDEYYVEYYNEDDCGNCEYCGFCNKQYHYNDINYLEYWLDELAGYDIAIEFEYGDDEEKCDQWDCPNCTSYLNCVERKVQ